MLVLKAAMQVIGGFFYVWEVMGISYASPIFKSLKKPA